MRPLPRLAASRLSGIGPGPVRPALRAGRQRPAVGPGTADRGPLGPPPAVRLPTDLGHARPRGLVGEQEDGASALASARAETGREAGPDQATPASRPGRQRLPSPPLTGQGRRLDLGLPLRPDRRRPEPEVAQPD